MGGNLNASKCASKTQLPCREVLTEIMFCYNENHFNSIRAVLNFKKIDSHLALSV